MQAWWTHTQEVNYNTYYFEHHVKNYGKYNKNWWRYEATFLDTHLELIIVNGRPFQLMEDSRFHKIVTQGGLGQNLQWMLKISKTKWPLFLPSFGKEWKKKSR